MHHLPLPPLLYQVVGGSIGYTIYYNVFVSEFTPTATHYISGVMMKELIITDTRLISEAIELIGALLLNRLRLIPGIARNETAY